MVAPTVGRRGRLAALGVAVLAAACGGSEVSQAGSRVPARQLDKVIRTHCSAVSGGFRACTVFHRTGGEVSRIERRQGTRWSVLLPAAGAPYPGRGWWPRVLAGPQGNTLLAEWSGECEIPFTYLITTRTLALRQVFRPQPSTPVGWTSGGLARVKLLKPIRASKTRVARSAGIYLVTPKGRVVRLERRVRPSLGC